MKKTVMCLSLISTCFANFSFANTQKLDERVCKGKAQNTAVSYADQGVMFNGTCQPNQDGKLIFQPPQPDITTETTISITSNINNEDLEIDAPILDDDQENMEIDTNEVDQPIISE